MRHRGRLLTLHKAAALLDWKDSGARRRLLRQLRNLEVEHGRDMMIRRGGRGRGVRYYVTRAVLEKHFGLECVTPVDVMRQLRDYVTDQSAEVRELKERVEELEDRCAGLTEAFRRHIASAHT